MGEQCEDLLRAAARIRRFFAKILLNRVVVGVNGEVGGMVQNCSQVSRGAPVEHGCLNVQTTDETTAAKTLVSAGFEQESLGQRLCLRCLAYPHKLEDETGGDCIPLFADEREVDLVAQ